MSKSKQFFNFLQQQRSSCLSKENAKCTLIKYLNLHQFIEEDNGLKKMIDKLGCIQIDPLFSGIGNNADIVAMARVKNYNLGGCYKELVGSGYASQLFFKEKCLLPTKKFFPRYRKHIVHPKYLKHDERVDKISNEIREEILKCLHKYGPLSANEIKQKINNQDGGGPNHKRRKLNNNNNNNNSISGFKLTSNPVLQTLQILLIQCEVVVVGKPCKFGENNETIYSIANQSPWGNSRSVLLNNLKPLRRNLDDFNSTERRKFDGFLLKERIKSIGLLRMKQVGSNWSCLEHCLKDEEFLKQFLSKEKKDIKIVQLEEHDHYFFCSKEFLELVNDKDDYDSHMRIIAPLDAVLWDKELINFLFDFEYKWEVYKRKEERKYGWYVSPLLHRGEFVGRIETKLKKDTKVGKNQKNVEFKIWKEKNKIFDQHAFNEMMKRIEIKISEAIER